MVPQCCCYEFGCLDWHKWTQCCGFCLNKLMGSWKYNKRALLVITILEATLHSRFGNTAPIWVWTVNREKTRRRFSFYSFVYVCVQRGNEPKCPLMWCFRDWQNFQKCSAYMTLNKTNISGTDYISSVPTTRDSLTQSWISHFYCVPELLNSWGSGESIILNKVKGG